MGIGSFFRSVWGGLKKGATKVWGGLKKGAEFVGRVAKPIGRLAEGAGKFIGLLPGRIGDVGRALAKGGAVVRQITDSLPDGAVRDKLTGALDRGEKLASTYTGRAQQFAEKLRDTGQPYLQAAPGIISKIGGIATDFAASH